MILKVHSTESNPTSSCKALPIIKALYDQKKINYDPTALGNCFQISLDILIAIAENGYDTNGWFFVLGECPPPQGKHAWLEYDGWVIDFASGQSTFAPVEDYLKVKRPSTVERHTIESVTEHIKTPEGREKMGIWDY
jgi:hypothetical protein